MSTSERLPAFLPWHTAQWRTLADAISRGRLHHALLLEGQPGLGKHDFARRLAAALLCEDPGPVADRPCGTCRSCALVAAGSHPDRLDLAPEEDRRVISVEQVRQRIADLALTPHYASRRVIVVHPADALNRHAANTLLKTLEEPPGGAVFVLVSARPATLPATVRSRCARVRFLPPPAEEGIRWLTAEGVATEADAAALLAWASGAPLAAQAAGEAGVREQFEAMNADLSQVVEGRLDPVKAAAGWRAIGLAQTLDWQLRVATEAMRINAMRDSSAASVAMQSICGRLDLAQLAGVCEELLEVRAALERQLNPAEQLALEGLAVTWRDAPRTQA